MAKQKMYLTYISNLYFPPLSRGIIVFGNILSYRKNFITLNINNGGTAKIEKGGREKFSADKNERWRY
jgi:hypothetical protein